MPTPATANLIQVTLDLDELHVLVANLVYLDIEHYVGLKALPELLDAKRVAHEFVGDLGSKRSAALCERLIKLHNAACPGENLEYKRTVK